MFCRLSFRCLCLFAWGAAAFSADESRIYKAFLVKSNEVRLFCDEREPDEGDTASSPNSLVVIKLPMIELIARRRLPLADCLRVIRSQRRLMRGQAQVTFIGSEPGDAKILYWHLTKTRRGCKSWFEGE